jgi:YegS/Rv2252/BmrU family lipid kinase
LKTLLLANPAAGGGKAGRELPPITEAARGWWPELTVASTSGPGEAATLAIDAVARGAERVIVVGGDGTVHETANGILTLPPERRPRLGVVPIGTGNDFAKLIGTGRKSPRAALEILARGRTGAYDVGRAWNEYFVNSLGLGFDAAVASKVPQHRRLWRPLVYPAAVLSSYFRFRPLASTIVSDHDVIDEPLFCLEVAIGISAGGGFYLTPDARPDDGLFDVCAVQPLNHWKFVTRMPTALWGGHIRFKEVRMLRTRRLQVLAAAPLMAHLDGETRMGGLEMEIELIPGALPVIIGAGQ